MFHIKPTRLAALLLVPMAPMFLLGMATPPSQAEEEAPPADNAVLMMDDLRDVSADLELLQERQIPMLLFFHATYCSYCQTVDEEFLQTMAEDEAYHDRLIIRRVEIDSPSPEIQWQGVSYTPVEFARLQGVQLVPQVMFFGPNGKQVVDELKGVTVPDFYPQYLEQRLEAAERCIDDPTLEVCTDGIDQPRRDLATEESPTT
ncbi:thioredoxin family protein [Guyparkeria hydrothermalis]|uniref:thioredoxin family protein n=1 Tax=Guyparkeria hydrothermalis TaxID=923 RepID=UPI002021F594|nr:thioredoxin family protein [Guyparkeria hydrothermalis]MCL7745010.1 thioredoxin family protein [Guyparkeria hydrothermalis]